MHDAQVVQVGSLVISIISTVHSAYIRSVSNYRKDMVTLSARYCSFLLFSMQANDSDCE